MSKRIQSFVRIRPYLEDQDGKNQINEYKIEKNKILLDNADFNFDNIYNTDQTNKQIYEQNIKDYIQNALKGINTTIFAYGQTCSGKTYTIFGHKNNEKGIIFNALDDIFSLNQNQDNPFVKASVSYYEIYNENINDLLNPTNNPYIQEVNGSFLLTDVTEFKVENSKKCFQLINNGNQNKVMGSSHLHDKSSRSHSIFRLHLAIKTKGLCEINFVDLAGSELLTDQYGFQQQKETKNINLSLFNLKNVMFSLSENASFVPYRNSSLTKLLQNSLGGNSQTAIICTISPLVIHIQDSKRTLSFGQVARKIVNNLLIEKNYIKKAENIQKEHIKINENNILFEKYDQDIDINLYSYLKVLNNEIHIYTYGNPETNNLAVLLPAYGDTGKYCFQYLYNSLHQKNFFVISIDYPSVENSKGKKLNVRGHEQSVPLLQKILNEGFPQYENICLIGYDYGAALALNYGILSGKNVKQVKQIFSFHPSWSQDYQILKDVKTKSILLWVKGEQLHPISQGEKMNSIIPKCKMIKLDCGKFNADKPRFYYRCIAQDVIKQIVDNLDQCFLPQNNQTVNKQVIDNCNTEQNQPQQEEEEEQKEEDLFDLDELLDNKFQYLYYNKNIKGACLRKNFQEKKNNNNFNYKYQEEPVESSSKETLQNWAIQRFKELLFTGEIEQYYKGYLNSTNLRSRAIKLFSNLPILEPYKDNLQILQQIWGGKLPKNIQLLKNFPQFLVGRQVLIKSKVNPFAYDKNYLNYDKNGQNIITHKATIQNYDEQKKTFQVYIHKDYSIEVSEDEIYLYNSPQQFQGNPLQEGLLFEDGVKCKYGDLLTRAKLMEAALSIEDIIQKIDYAENFNQQTELEKINLNIKTLTLQQKCVERISQCIDLIHLVQEGIDPNRYTAFECGKLAYYGQGNCHTFASVLSAFLLPFSFVLGLEVRFRAGSLLKVGREINENREKVEKWDGKHKFNVEDHTWLDITYQPCQKTFVFDKADYINNMDISQAYSRFMHISERVQCNSKIRKSTNIFSNQYICQNNEEIIQVWENINSQQEIFGDKSIFEKFNWEKILILQ